MAKTNKADIRKDLEEYNALEAVQFSTGGKILLKNSLVDIISVVDALASGYKELTHIEMISYCAKLNERLNLYRSLRNSTKNKKFAQIALEEALKIEPDEIPD